MLHVGYCVVDTSITGFPASYQTKIFFNNLNVSVFKFICTTTSKNKNPVHIASFATNSFHSIEVLCFFLHASNANYDVAKVVRWSKNLVLWCTKHAQLLGLHCWLWRRAMGSYYHLLGFHSHLEQCTDYLSKVLIAFLVTAHYLLVY